MALRILRVSLLLGAFRRGVASPWIPVMLRLIHLVGVYIWSYSEDAVKARECRLQLRLGMGVVLLSTRSCGGEAEVEQCLTLYCRWCGV